VQPIVYSSKKIEEFVVRAEDMKTLRIDRLLVHMYNHLSLNQWGQTRLIKG
jgi:hypothetical protein